MKMEQTEHSESLAFKLQTPVNHPEESIQHSEHGDILKSRIDGICGERTEIMLDVLKLRTSTLHLTATLGLTLILSHQVFTLACIIISKF
jgi:hypothetical protein